jgi:cell division protein FtsB
MIIDTADKKKRRAYSASRHYDDYKIQDASGNVDGRRGLRLGESGVQVLEVFQTPGISAPPTEPVPVSTARTETIPMPPAHITKPAKTPKPAKPAKQIKPHNWRISDAAHKILAKDWILAEDEHQSDVFERVLAFAGAAKGLAGTMELPVGQIAPETLLDTFTTKFHTLSENFKKASAQVDKLKFDQHQLGAERDALTARVAALQTQVQDASIRQTPPVELLPFARRVLELSSKSGSLPPAELRESLMRLAIDAITQAEGSPAAAPATDHRTESPKLEHDKASSVSTAVLPHPLQQTAPAPETTSVSSVADEGNGSEAPVASKNRNTLKAEAKLKKALDYLIDLNEHTTNRSEKWVINSSLLFSLTGCFRPAVNTFVEAHQQTIDELNRTHGLGPGHNRTRARTQPNAISDLVKKFKESVLGQPF